MQIQVQFFADGDFLTGFTVSGHDEIAADKGYSILCAAVSSAVQLTLNTLTEYFGVPERAVHISASRGAENRISLRMQNVSRTQSDILRGLLLHFQQLSEDNSALLVKRTADGHTK